MTNDAPTPLPPTALGSTPPGRPSKGRKAQGILKGTGLVVLGLIIGACMAHGGATQNAAAAHPAPTVTVTQPGPERVVTETPSPAPAVTVTVTAAATPAATPTTSAPPPAADSAAADDTGSSGMTLAKFDKLSNGMSKKEVFAVTGQCELMSNSSIAGYSDEMYDCKATSGYGNATVMFQNGSLISKSQFGLE